MNSSKKVTMTQIYILNSATPRFEFTTEETQGLPVNRWEDICQQKENFIFIKHEDYRSISRWDSAIRKRPYLVYSSKRYQIGASKTLSGAIKIAKAAA